MASNPFFEKSPLPYQAPPFDKVLLEHYRPAFERGFEQQLQELEAIKRNSGAPTFHNTVEALEVSGQLLKRVQGVFQNLCMANTSPELQQLEEEFAPRFAQHRDSIFLDKNLFQQLKAVYDSREGLEGEELRLVEYYYQVFTIAGAELDDARKRELRQVNERLATLQTAFTSKVLAASRKGALLVDTEAEIDGLSGDEIAAAQAEAQAAGHPGKFALTLFNTTQQPLFVSLRDRRTRERLFEASVRRNQKGDEVDTRECVEEMVRLRLRKGQLLGKTCFAEWKLQDQMADVPAANGLMRDIAAPAVEAAKKEAEDIQKLIRAGGADFTLEPWDWTFYSERVRKEKYDLEENEIKPYFELHTVLEKGVFYAAEQLYGITFRKRTDLPVYDPDVTVYEVLDGDGTAIALYYLDFYTRPNKNGGAWMSIYVEQSRALGQKPVVTNVFNYVKPSAGKPALLTYSEVTTMFHEFGHSLHGIFPNCKYATCSNLAYVPTDFVELPSQINENWALDLQVLRNYAFHYETKRPIPDSLVRKIISAEQFNQGFKTLEVVSAAMVDMAWHTVSDIAAFKPALAFEKDALERYRVNMKEVPPRYSSPYFSHIFAGDYCAGYYAYLWSEMLAHDGFDWFKQNGGLTRANGDRFRQHILAVGNSMNLNDAFYRFTGRKPSITPLLRARGFLK